MAVTKEKEVPIDIMFSLFDSFVGPISNYGCEVWGFARADNLERVHRKFCKWLLNVKQSSSNVALYGDLGGLSFFVGRQIRIIKYWLKIIHVKNNNCILWNIYYMLRNELKAYQNVTNLVSNEKNILERTGFPDV